MNPEYAEVNGKKYKINTNYENALRCLEVHQDNSIGMYEKALATIYLLFGEEALNDKNNHEILLKKAIFYLSLGEEKSLDSEKDMDFIQDKRLIDISIKTDYGIDIRNTDMHWWDYYDHVNGLTEKCILNRVREIRTFDTSKIEDKKEKEKIEQMKKRYSLKKSPVIHNLEEKKSIKSFYESMYGKK